MKVKQFIEKVRSMRLHQDAWFSHHRHNDLVTAKQLEREVDSALSKGIEPDEPTPALDFVADQRPNDEPEQKPLFTEGEQ